MPNVYLPAVPMRTDPDSGLRVPALDVSSAAQYGDMVTLLRVDRPIRPAEMGSAILALRKQLAEIAVDDFVVCVGDPVLIAATVSFAVNRHGVAQLLRWDRRLKHYERVEVFL